MWTKPNSSRRSEEMSSGRQRAAQEIADGLGRLYFLSEVHGSWIKR